MCAVMSHVQTYVQVWFQGAQQPTQEAMLTVTNHVLQRWNKGLLFFVPRPKERMHIAFWSESGENIGKLKDHRLLRTSLGASTRHEARVLLGKG